MIPSVFNGIEVRRLCRSIQKLDILLLKPPLSSSGDMFEVIILLDRKSVV